MLVEQEMEEVWKKDREVLSREHEVEHTQQSKADERWQQDEVAAVKKRRKELQGDKAKMRSGIRCKVRRRKEERRSARRAKRSSQGREKKQQWRQDKGTKDRGEQTS